jgi:hypothetical protein
MTKRAQYGPDSERDSGDYEGSHRTEEDHGTLPGGAVLVKEPAPIGRDTDRS